MKKKLRLLFCYFVITNIVQAQPANDDCNGAIGVTLSPFGVGCSAGISTTTSGATASLPAPVCGGSAADDDIWYSFVPDHASVVIRISNAVLTNGGLANASVAVYSGSCAVPTQLLCVNGVGVTNGFRVLSGLIPGNTYYLRIWSTVSGVAMNFNFCVQDVPDPPSNDECVNAILITPQPFASPCSTAITVNTAGATQSPVNPSCTSTANNDDVWYRFTASAASIVIRYTNAIQLLNNSGVALGYALYAGSCPSTSATVSCDNSIGFSSGTILVNGLTIGAEYYLRLFGGVSNNFVQFDFCVQDLPVPPANDECAGAFPLTLDPFGAACITPVHANTYGATRSQPNVTCINSPNDDDIWYRFQATTETILLRVYNAIGYLSGTATQIGVAIHPDNCPVTSSLLCNSIITAGSGYQIINGLTPGQFYYIRFWEWSTLTYASFDFCLQAVPSAPNDECAGALTVPVLPVGTLCNATTAVSTVGATGSANPPGCAGAFTDDDVWYAFTANTGGVRMFFSNALQPNLPASGNAPLGFAIYDNACPVSSDALFCNALAGSGSGNELIGGLIPGHRYYLRFFSYGTNTYINFDFCLVDVDLPTNDECTYATELTVTNGFATAPSSGYLANATTSAGFGFSACGPPIGSEDIWYKLTVPPTGNVTIQTFPVVYPQNIDIVMEAYAGVCGSLSMIGCDDDGNPDPNPSDVHARILLTGRSPGETIYIRVMAKFPTNSPSFLVGAWDHSQLPAIAPGGNCVDAVPVTINVSNQNLWRWVPIFDGSGNIVAEIYPGGFSYGLLEASVFTNSSGTVRNDNGHYYLDRNLAIQAGVSGPARVRYYFTNAELSSLQSVDPSVVSADQLSVTKTSAGCETVISGPQVAQSSDSTMPYGSDHVLQFNSSSFSSFYLFGPGAALPLRFIYFSGSVRDNDAVLSWQVVKDDQIRSFEVEKSVDGQVFETLVNLDRFDFEKEEPGAWTYQYSDRHFREQVSFYRIRLISGNGTVIFSEVVKLIRNPDPRGRFIIFPNPSEGRVSIQSKGTPFQGDLEILDLAGRRVRSFSRIWFGQTLVFDIGDLTKGTYLIRISNQETRQTYYEKLIKQ